MRYLFMTLMAFMAAASACLAQPVRDYTMRIDVVELLDRGRQIAGLADHELKRGKHTYLFASNENKAAFERSPDRYEIQMGGACARMGPLSGDGTTKLFAVHDGRLYVFASESCRMTFQASPEKFIDADDAPLVATEESRKRGRALLGRAVDAISCVAGIDNLTSYRETLARDEESGGTNYRVTNTITLAFPNKLRTEVCWNDACWSYVLADTTAWSMGNDQTSTLNAQQQTALRVAALHPLTILRARDVQDFVIISTDQKRTIAVPEEGQVEVTLVAVHLHGITAELGLDEKHRVRLLSSRGRGPNSTIGRVDRIYSQFHDVDGLLLPGRVDVFFDGQSVANNSGTFVEQVINDPADAARFEPQEPQSAAADGKP